MRCWLCVNETLNPLLIAFFCAGVRVYTVFVLVNTMFPFIFRYLLPIDWLLDAQRPVVILSCMLRTETHYQKLQWVSTVIQTVRYEGRWKLFCNCKMKICFEDSKAALKQVTFRKVKELLKWFFISIHKREA